MAIFPHRDPGTASADVIEQKLRETEAETARLAAEIAALNGTLTAHDEQLDHLAVEQELDGIDHAAEMADLRKQVKKDGETVAAKQAALRSLSRRAAEMEHRLHEARVAEHRAERERLAKEYEVAVDELQPLLRQAAAVQRRARAAASAEDELRRSPLAYPADMAQQFQRTGMYSAAASLLAERFIGPDMSDVEASIEREEHPKPPPLSSPQKGILGDRRLNASDQR